MLLTRAEVAAKLRVHVGTVDRLIKAGHIVATKAPGTNGSVRIEDEELARYIECGKGARVETASA